jgi:hypothetical protein
VLLLVLPGAGLVIILAGLLVLASEFPALERYVDPVRERAMKDAEDSVSSPLRITGSVLAGAALIGAGIAWAIVPDLPLGGWEHRIKPHPLRVHPFWIAVVELPPAPRTLIRRRIHGRACRR